jgi:hypothetical protein
MTAEEILERHDVQRAGDSLRSDYGSDFELLRAATASGRAVAAARMPASSFLSRRRFPTAGRGFGRLVAALDALLVAHPGERELASQCVWLEPPAGVQP